MKAFLKKLICRPVRLAAAFCVICCAASASLSVSSYSRFPDAAEAAGETAAKESAEAPASAASKADALYLVKEYEGKVCVFRCPEETEEERLDVYVYSLPESDRRYLKQGIYLYSGRALCSLIEDYSD
ncbi:MAG: hypothetical protein IJR89_08005 [Clostridia bacterium]|nr:hypothetical protein [Clostridia bacterium]